MKKAFKKLLVLAVALSAPGVATARNVDLSTVPARDSVQLTIYNSEDLTLVRETRTVTFKPGPNLLQFSWANTLIDPTSVQLKFLTKAEQLDVADTTFPHDKPQQLVWNVNSELDGAAQIEITYFTSGISWKADYLCIAGADEKQMSFEGFVRVFNNSGEEYDDAQIRLVVGTINLVEKIAQLAGITPEKVEKLREEAKSDMKRQVMTESLARASGKAGAANAPAPKEIIKEGLSEYFIYSIEGTESISNGWSKRLRSFEGGTVPFKIEYRYRPQEYGEQLVRMYLLTNNKESKLGTTPLPDGIVRLFRDNGRDGLTYLTQQSIKYVPIGDKIELNLGADPEVIFELVKLRVFRNNIWLQIQGTNTFKQADGENVEIEEKSNVVGWDDHEIYSQRIRNYTGRPIDVEIRRSYDGDVVFRSQLEPKLFDYRTVEFRTQVAAGKRADLLFEIVRRQGRNTKQNNVTVADGKVEP